MTNGDTKITYFLPDKIHKLDVVRSIANHHTAQQMLPVRSEDVPGE